MSKLHVCLSDCHRSRLPLGAVGLETEKTLLKNDFKRDVSEPAVTS